MFDCILKVEKRHEGAWRETQSEKEWDREEGNEWDQSKGALCVCGT